MNTRRTIRISTVARGSLLVVLLLAASPVPAATYYLDAAASGSTFDGSQGHPWQTVEQMQQFIHDLPDHGSGDTILIAPGSYGDFVDGALASSGFSTLQTYRDPRTDWLTLKAQDPTDKPVFRYVHVYGARDAYLELDGLHIISDAPHVYSNCIYVRNGVRHLRFVNLNIEAEDDQSALPTGITITYDNPTDILIDGCEIHHLGVGASPGGDDITLSNNHLHHLASSGIKSGGGTNMVVEDNTIHDQIARIVRLNIYGPVSGAFTKYESITQDVTGATATVYVIRSDSIEVTPSNKVVIEFQPGYPVRSDTGTGVVGALTDITVADRSHGSGLSVRTNGYTARRNHIYDFGSSAGIFVYGISQPYSNMLFENNLVYDAISREVVLNDIGDNFVFRNNTIAGGVHAYFYSGYDGAGLKLHNNLLGNLTLWDAGPLSTIVEGNNILQSIAIRNPYSNNGAFPAGSTSVVLGQDNDDAFDDLFVDAAGNDFQLADSSQAIGFADPAHAPTDDLLGYGRDGIAPSAGAYEFGAGFIPGDSNGDGLVDLDDFVILKQNFGTMTEARRDQGDNDGDRDVDLDDFVIFKQNFGR